MKQRELEISLQKLANFSDPKAELEQYPTPAKIAADILYTAHGLGDIQSRSVIDLGCGTGVFSIGACLLGAETVTGLDIDRVSLNTAEENAKKTGCRIQFVCDTVENATGEYDTCIMNPPFGAQTRHADLPFLDKAMELAGVVYSIHNSETVNFIRKRVDRNGCVIQAEKKYKLEIRHTFKFHTKERALFDVTLIRIVKT